MAGSQVTPPVPPDSADRGVSWWHRGGWLLLALGALLAGLLMAGCSSGEEAQAHVTINMLDDFFGRDLTRVPIDTSVRFVNDGRNPHNAVDAKGAWKTPVDMKRGDAKLVRFSQPGVYRFYCTFHGTANGKGMAATLVVGNAYYNPAEQATGKTLAPVAQASGQVQRVPQQHRTIQAAVNASQPGDLVLISPGVYREEVKVAIPSLVLRGTDRNAVVIDAEFKRPNAISITADGVAVENLTARNGLTNGVFWTGVKGYRASYVTAHANKEYGVYAFDSVDGVFEHSYASASADSGFYIGQCNPCRAVITDVVAENNALGYSGTNASGELYIVRSTWRRNWAGIVPNTLDTELLPPFREVTIVGNVVEGNGNPEAPGKGIQWGAFGNGVVLAGGNDSVVERNRIVDHPLHGILITPNLDRRFWMSSGNRVRGNVIRGSGRADLALSAPAGNGNCFQGNDVRSSAPPGLQALHSCDGLRLPLGMDLSTMALSLGRVAETHHEDYPKHRPEDAPPPPPQPQLPGGASAPVRPAMDVFTRFSMNLASIPVPANPDGHSATIRKEPTVSGVPILAASPWQLVFALYGYLLPFVLYAAWTSLAFWDLARRDDLGRGATLAWVAVVLLVPFLGVIGYHVLGRSKLPGWLRAAVVGGGVAAYLVILAIGALLGGIA